MKSSRLLAILLTLERRRTATAAELAERLEVSVRTIYRDVAALTAAGVPVWTESGPGGGIRLAPGWTADLGGLTGDEASALSLAGAPQAANALGLARLLASAKAKVDATLPPELRGRAQRLEERFLLDAPRWFARPEPLDALPAVADAVWSDRRLDLRYGPRRRRVDPLGLVLKAGVWYLVARHRAAIKSYRVSRITAARARPAEGVTRPEGFSLAAWWAEAQRGFDDALLRYPCRVRLSAGALRRLTAVIPGEAVKEMIAAAEAADQEGWRAVTLRLESEEVAASQLLALGDEVEILGPATLRQRFAATAARMLARNGGTDCFTDAPCRRGQTRYTEAHEHSHPLGKPPDPRRRRL